MKNRFIAISVFLFMTLAAAAQEYTWTAVPVVGERTGCTTPSKDNVRESIGYLKGGKYYAPNGTVHGRRSAAAKAARAVLAAQPAMARVKDVIAYSPEAMDKEYPESELSNMYVDIIIRKVQELSGKKVHMGVTNFGGIRVDMPKGDVLLDDMLSMFPFKNSLVYVEHKGSVIRGWLEDMAAGKFQVLGGVKVVAEDGKLVSVEIDGEPLDDDKVYGVATISFLMEGGDGLAIGRGALSVTDFKEWDIIDAVLEYIYAETKAGRPIVYHKDGRVVIR